MAWRTVFFAGETLLGDDLAILLYTQDYLGEGGSREMFVFAYFFVLCSSHSLPSPTRWAWGISLILQRGLSLLSLADYKH
jgi:hypothetical protein